MKKSIKVILLSILGLVLILCIIYKDKMYRLHFALQMFSGAEQVERFRSVEKYFPTRIIAPKNKSELKEGAKIKLPNTYFFNGIKKSTKDLLDETDVTGLAILKNDSLVFENYYQGNTRNSHTIAWSVTKSFVSALMGVAIAEGSITSINEKASKYVPELLGSAYENITLKNLLQMSSGVSWNEDYSDDNSDINRFGRTLALGGSFESFVKTLSKDKQQGTYNRYNSSDTQALGMVISRATGKTLSKYLEEKIWHPLGMENKAWWLIDDDGNEFAAAGLSASLRDYARFGLLFLHQGKWNNQQIIPVDWVKQSLTANEPHLIPGPNPNSNNDFGYGYQWWIFDGNEGEYAALGIYNQMIYVNPTHHIVIVKSSANNNYGTTNDESSFREKETLAFLREIVSSLK